MLAGIVQSVSPNQPLTPADIFAKHAAAVGYSLSAGTEKPYVLHETTKWHDKNGDHVITAVEKRAGAYSFTTVTREGIQRTWGFDGNGFWDADSNGNVANLIGYGRPFDVTWSIIDSEAFDATIDSTIRSTTDADYVVRISPSSGVPADLSFNKTTFLIDSVVVDPGRDNIEESYADYKRFGPVLIATTRKNEDATTTVTDFTQPVTTSNINTADNLVGFQGDFTFDSSVVTFQSPPVSKAGLTAGNWNIWASPGRAVTNCAFASMTSSTPLALKQANWPFI